MRHTPSLESLSKVKLVRAVTNFVFTAALGIVDSYSVLLNEGRYLSLP